MIDKRCINDIFGYCKIGKQGDEISSKNGDIKYFGVSGGCNKNPKTCEHYIKHSDLIKAEGG